ncbi:MAG: MotA/TolQ/ExbB proton channel family protein [bacterium]|nr:MAG: MotA/TolQ/ExbB proton channel family protein [bacterium]
MFNRNLILVISVIFLLFLSNEDLLALAQISTGDSTFQTSDSTQVTNSTTDVAKVNKIDPASLTKLKDIKSLWDITRFGGIFRWFIIGIFILGMITVLYKVSELLLDNQHSRELEKLNLRKITLVDVMRVIKNNKSSMLSHLFKYMLDLYQTRRSAEGFSDEIIDFVQIRQDRFQAFQTKMSFFSDTAGALGLLGTVWGMFLTFFGGDLEKHKILSGMGVALITTLMGLVVSIFLNLFTTQTHSYFRKRIDKVTDLGNQFRLRLHQLEQTLDNSLSDDGEDFESQDDYQPYEISDAVIAAVDQQLKSPEPIFDLNSNSMLNKKFEDNNYKLIPVSGDNQTVKVNTRLEKPLVVQISNNNGSGIANKPLIFEVVKGDGKLSNGRKQEEVLSDASGLSQTDLIMGSSAGEHQVCVKLKNSENSYIHFSAWGKPTEPDQMIYVSGNHQNSPSGKELKESFVVKVIDKFDNPVPDWPVTYKVVKGKGFFPEKKSIFLTKTDDKGIAEAYYTLGDKPGFNSVRAIAKGIRRAKIEFEAMGQG